MKNEYEGSRYKRLTKERKKNIILNSLIGVVLLLIIVVSVNVFSGNKDEETAKPEENVTEEPAKTDVEESSTEEKEQEDSPVEETEPATETEEEPAGETVEEPSTPSKEEEVVTEGGTDSNVIRTIVNPSWEPVGTVQTGEHVNQYDGVDWDEMVKAIHYATGLAENNMTIQFLGNNGPNKSVGTVYSKDKSQIYRVYIEWVDGGGWKPTKVEELSEIQ
ncbi:YrrS family protein [Robertmurraya massiliosenegalensis]|uniref:YrrS family protein n=1 Tax=Robertmurraya massiliosenegalensis TaxID=1287657 RepID=UPI0002E504BE|nr:YrrS family protein [Robertmurraya massiliosenegalensis]